jgi:hypothetical protein
MTQWNEFVDGFKALKNKQELEAFAGRFGLRWHGMRTPSHVIAAGTVDGTDMQIKLTEHDHGGAAPELSDMAAIEVDDKVVQEIMFSPPGWQES